MFHKPDITQMFYKKKWISPSEAAKRLGCTSQSIRNFCRQKKIIHKVSEDGRFGVSAVDVDRILNEELKRGFAG